MIVDRLDRADAYAKVNKNFAKALAFFRESDFDKLPQGRCEIDGDDLYAIVIKGTGSGKDGASLEAHRKYIDIQYLHSGSDCMGWKSLAQCKSVASQYDPESDAELFSDEPSTWVNVGAGELAVFFPTDAHAPGAGEGEFHKVVVKVRAE